MAEWSKAINCKFIDIFIFIGSNPISLFFCEYGEIGKHTNFRN